MSDNIPDNCVIYLKIFLDYVVSHAGHHLPWCLRVIGFEFLCQEVGGLVYNLNIFDDSIVHHVIIGKVGK